jgi:hypothetical protein
MWHIFERTVYTESGLENRDYGRRRSAALTKQHPSIRKSWWLFKHSVPHCCTNQTASVVDLLLEASWFRTYVKHRDLRGKRGIRVRFNQALLVPLPIHIPLTFNIY